MCYLTRIIPWFECGLALTMVSGEICRDLCAVVDMNLVVTGLGFKYAYKPLMGCVLWRGTARRRWL